MIEFTGSEIEAMKSSPEVLRIIADWRDSQQCEADAIGIGSTGDMERATQLREEAARLENEY